MALVAGGVALEAAAAPIKMTVRPKGTNQVELTFGPVIPGCPYGVLARGPGAAGHWMSFGGGFIGPSNQTITATCNLGGDGDLKDLTPGTLGQWRFVAGYWGDSDGDGLADTYEDLVTRTDPFSGGDGYSDPDGDNWNNLQEMANNTDPLRANFPPPPRLSTAFFFNTNSTRVGKAVLTIEATGAVLPEYYVVERAARTPRPPAEAQRYPRPIPGQRRYGMGTNQAAYPRSIPNRPPLGRREDPFVTGPFQAVARVTTRPGVHEYTYVETNVDTLLQPQYRVNAHFQPPPRAQLNRLDRTSIQQTLLAVNVRQTGTGYDLSVTHPIPYGRYLLLVRDRTNPQWRASGYFTAGTNRAPVSLQTDTQGMMTAGQSPIALPPVRFLPRVVEPEFTAGWGEDSDGDGLPDIYEVLVTGTDPLSADTGETGILDGYKEPMNDGWSILEKFRRRADPLKAAAPPSMAVLLRPPATEAFRACSPQTDLRYEPQVEIRPAGTSRFQQLQLPLLGYYQTTNARDAYHERPNFDLRISWRVPERRPPEPGYHGP